MIEEHFLPTTILKNMSKQKIFDDLLTNMKRRVNQRKITTNSDGNFIKILEDKVEMIDKINNELNGINSKFTDKTYKQDKNQKKRTKTKKNENLGTETPSQIAMSKGKNGRKNRNTLILPNINNHKLNTYKNTPGNNIVNVNNRISHSKKISETNKNNYNIPRRETSNILQTADHQLNNTNDAGLNINKPIIHVNTIDSEVLSSSDRLSMHVDRKNIFSDSNKNTNNNSNNISNIEIIPYESSNNIIENTYTNNPKNYNNFKKKITLPGNLQFEASNKPQLMYDHTIDNKSSKSLNYLNNLHLNSASHVININRSPSKSRNLSTHTQAALENYNPGHLKNKSDNLLKNPAPSKFSVSLQNQIKDPEIENILVDFQNEERRKGIYMPNNNQVQLFINLLKEKLEKNNKKKGINIVDTRPGTLKPGSMLNKIYNKCLKEFEISLEIDKVLNNEKSRSVAGEMKEFENFTKFFKKEQNYFIEEILRIKDKDHSRKVFLYNKTKDPSNIDITKISDHLAYVNRKFFIERYGYNYSEEADFIFQDMLNEDKGGANSHTKAEEKRNKKHEQIENYLDNTIKKKKELISHLSKKLTFSSENEKKKKLQHSNDIHNV